MNRALWITQISLGVYFVAIGVMHFIVPPGLPVPMAWMYDLQPWMHWVSGIAEILGGIGLILPSLTRIKPQLTVWAGLGLVESEPVDRWSSVRITISLLNTMVGLLILVRKPGSEVTKEDVLNYLQGKIADWWMPEAVEFVDEIPHTATGKIQKMALRETFGGYQF